MDQFLLGCCYYPEHLDRKDMRRDLEKIKALGLNTVRMGEFAWSMYEKEEGCYDFSWLREAVEIAGELSLHVILGTPTAAPPKWLIDRYPEVLARDEKGVVMHHGARQHHNHTSEIYLSYCAKITEEMVKAFCGYPQVIGWQIDNELNCHRQESYSDADDAAFQKWLEEKYGDVENLNRAWGTRFWSQEYNDFSQIECPKVCPAYKNPVALTDYYLFLSDAAIHYASVQAQIIRKYCPHAFITHNGLFENLDYKKFTRECLDFLSYDSYPSFQEKLGPALGRNLAYQLALTRGCSDPFMILEQQSGPGGQLFYLLPTPKPGQIRLWTYQDIAHGAAGVLYFRYRTPLFGAEQIWYGIYGHDGEENLRTQEIRQIAGELERLGPLFLKERPHNQIGIFRDYHNQCMNKVESFAGEEHWEIFMALNHRNLHADFVYTPEEFEKYKVIILPHVTIADEKLQKAISDFAGKGGIVLLSARSGIKDQEAHYRPLTPPGIFREAAGCRVDWFTALSSHETQQALYQGKAYEVDGYYEVLEAEAGETAASYTQGFGAGKSAIVKNGNIYYIGFYCRKAAALYADIIAKYVKAPAPIDQDVEQIPLGGYLLLLNHSDREIAHTCYDYITCGSIAALPPYGVALVKEE